MFSLAQGVREILEEDIQACCRFLTVCLHWALGFLIQFGRQGVCLVKTTSIDGLKNHQTTTAESIHTAYCNLEKFNS
jgi:hypothetical protein